MNDCLLYSTQSDNNDIFKSKSVESSGWVLFMVARDADADDDE
jgi:hypothetical protein